MGKTTENNEDSKPEIWNDPRFSHLVSDPRFRALPKKQRKVKIDKRFESMFHDEKFKVKYTVDKYGRRVDKTSTEDLKKYYDIESSDEEDEEEERKLEEKVIAKDEPGEDESAGSNDELGDDGEVLPSDIKKKLQDSKIDYARGEGRLLTDSSSDEESSEEDDEVFIEHVWGELDNDAPKTDESTRRLAACNMDWDRIRASDIFVLCNSFLPPGGSILSVTVYPSEFGKQRMAEEELHGPPELVKNDDSDSDEEDLVKEQDSDAEEGDSYHMEKLREYQLNRLKYYYAVIECDTVATADKLYKECDGLEYESTATKLDLRFIPDDVTFDEDEPREKCTELPDLTKYKPRLFATTALYQAKVDLTWDETELERKELNEKIAAGKLNEITDADLRKYVACSSDEDEEENEKDSKSEENETSEDQEKLGKPKNEIALYKSLLEEINKKEEEAKKDKFEMEYSWGINVDTKSKEKTEETKKNLTPIEKILEKKREKNKRRKEERKKKKKGTDDEEHYSSDDLPDGIDLNDPYFAEEFANGDFERPKQNKNNKKKSKKSTTANNSDEEEKEAKELELLLDDGEDDRQHFSLEKIQKAENEPKSKKKRRKLLKKSKQEIQASKTEVEDNFEVDVEDNRFKALYTSHLFNIDPTDPHFKKTKGMEKIIQEKLKRRHSKPEKIQKGEESDEEPTPKQSKPNLENRLLVKNLKRKIKGNKS